MHLCNNYYNYVSHIYIYFEKLVGVRIFFNNIFSSKDFSLSKWISDKKADLQGASLEQWAIDLLKSELKISNFLLNPACSRASLSVGAGNWNLACKIF